MTNIVFPTKSEIREHILPIYNAVSEGDGPTAADFLDQAISVEYIVSGQLNYLGARIFFNYEDAMIFIDTNDKTIEAYWNGEKHLQLYYHDKMNLNDACKEMFKIAVSNRYS